MVARRTYKDIKQIAFFFIIIEEFLDYKNPFQLLRTECSYKGENCVKNIIKFS